MDAGGQGLVYHRVFGSASANKIGTECSQGWIFSAAQAAMQSPKNTKGEEPKLLPLSRNTKSGLVDQIFAVDAGAAGTRSGYV
jgi:hypothetical protein